MTENDERVLRDIIIDGNGYDYDESIPQSIFEEIKQYKTIGTVEEFKALKENERKCEDCAGCTAWNCDCANERAKAIDEFAERLKYEHKQTITTESVYISRSFDEVVDEIAEEMRGAE